MTLIRRVGKWMLYYLSDPRNLFGTERVVASNDGLMFHCLAENLIERSILNGGVWAAEETYAMNKLLKPGSVVFDIGANIGYFTLLMSKLVGVNGQVHSFEPMDYAFERLRSNMIINPTLPLHNITLNNKALSWCNEAKIECFESQFSSKVLAHSERKLIDFVTLDGYFAASLLDRLDFIKIDVDGYDYHVIQGGVKVLRRYKPMVMAELCNRALVERGVDVVKYLTLFLECGYSNCTLLAYDEVLSLENVVNDRRFRSYISGWDVLLS
jgi:FkbM family methyltransferase